MLYPQGTLLLIPQQIALAAVADGWICRNDCIYAKVAPMPESVAGWKWQQAPCSCGTEAREARIARQTAASGLDRAHIHGRDFSIAPDPACSTCHGTGRAGDPVLRRGSWRHTRAHEVILMLCKSMGYYADGEAVREEAQNWGPRNRQDAKHNTEGFRSAGQPPHQGLTDGDWQNRGRNPRSVLTPAPSPLELPHYAAFPPSLIEPIIKATCPAQCCAVCGTGWAPVVTHTNMTPGTTGGATPYDAHRPDGRTLRAGGFGAGSRTVYGAHPSCACVTDLPPVPGTCLDPFGGSGTTGLVARALRRRAILIEASPAYVQLSRERLGLTVLQQWEKGNKSDAQSENFNDLPLFAQEE